MASRKAFLERSYHVEGHLVEVWNLNLRYAPMWEVRVNGQEFGFRSRKEVETYLTERGMKEAPPSQENIDGETISPSDDEESTTSDEVK